MSKLDALSVAQWFYNENETVRASNLDAHLKLQKLVYYAQAMYSSVFEERLYNNRIEAWKNGPVIREVYIEKKHNSIKFRDRADEIIEFDDDVVQVLNVVNSVYGTLSANELVDLSHSEEPWKELEKKALNKENPEIKYEKIESFYSDLVEVYNAYEGFNFDNEEVETINGNNFCYMTDNIEYLTEREKEELFSIGLDSRGNTFNVSRMVPGDEESRLVIY